MKQERFTFRLSTEDFQTMEEEALKSGLTKSEFLRKVIREYALTKRVTRLVKLDVGHRESEG